MPYVLAPLVYLFCLKFLGEHSFFTEISGFVLLSLSALVAKLATTGLIDPALFATVAIFFTAGVFKVRVQFRKGILHRVLMVIYIGFAIAVYRLIHTPVLVLLPLIDNLDLFDHPIPGEIKGDRMAGSAERGCLSAADGL